MVEEHWYIYNKPEGDVSSSANSGIRSTSRADIVTIFNFMRVGKQRPFQRHTKRRASFFVDSLRSRPMEKNA
jgi:hypothetical protein